MLTYDDYRDAIVTIGIASQIILQDMERRLQGCTTGEVVENNGVKWLCYGISHHYEEVQAAFKKLLKHKVIIESTGLLTDLLNEKAKREFPGDPWPEEKNVPYYTINVREGWKLPAKRTFK